MDIEIHTLKTKDRLNEDIWGENQTLKPDIRNKLLKIAQDFFHELDVEWAELEDIILTGSIVNYNWSKHSDIDLHLVVDFSLVDENTDLVDAYFNARKKLWNDEHDIKVHGYEVEVYVEDASQGAISGGKYSIMHDYWIKKPKYKDPTIDKNTIKRKVDLFAKFANKIEEMLENKNFEEAIETSEWAWNKLKKMRKCGLESGGEYSTENLAYKVLRRKGIIQKLFDVKIEAYDQMMSIE